MIESLKELLKNPKFNKPLTQEEFDELMNDPDFVELNELSKSLDGYDMSNLLRPTPELDALIKKDLEFNTDDIEPHAWIGVGPLYFWGIEVGYSDGNSITWHDNSEKPLDTTEG